MGRRKAVTGETDDILTQARKSFELAREWWHDNQAEAKDDLEFARLNKQWPEAIRRQRELENRPCHTFNKMPAFIRQVVNDARQNKPSIKVHPQDSKADPRTAETIGGLIRNIEVTSDADVAYDTAIEHAVGQGYGFWRINTAYSCDDTFDQDIVIERISNPFTVYGDPNSTAADSSDWNVAFVVTTLTKDEFEREYPDAEKVDWESDFKAATGWIEGDNVTVAEWWTREKVRGAIVALSDGSILKLEEYEEKAGELSAAGIEQIGEPRETETHKVTQRIISGAEVLREVKWAGKYIPIIPVYGDEVIDADGKRHFRSLIRDAKSAQQMFNYWRTTTTELVALAPKAPWVGEEKAFSIDPNWDTANSVSHSKLMVPDGATPPQRQPFSGVPAGAMQEALNASDDMKAIIGIFDASLGARSNETSGKAILARQREGDVSTFHFIDNLTRAIRHSGRVLLDLIPKVYSTERVIRVLGEEQQPQTAQIGPVGVPVQEQYGDPTPEEVALAREEQREPQPSLIGHIFDPTIGKYDLSVTAGPSFTSRREEVRELLTEASQGAPAQFQAVLLPRIFELMDIPDAEKLAQQLQQAMNPQGQQGVPVEQVQKLQQQATQALQQLHQQLSEAQTRLNDKSLESEREMRKLDIEAYNAETDRLKATTAKNFPLGPDAEAELAPIVEEMVRHLLASPDILSPAPDYPPQVM